MQDAFGKSGLTLSQKFYLPIKSRPKFNFRYGQMVMAVGMVAWQNFIQSAKHLKNPYDKWGEKIIKSQYKHYILPNQPARNGFYPFVAWAKLAGFSQSPLGMAIHPKYGLWVSQRGAIFHKKAKIPYRHRQIKPCITCQTKDCISACPAQALDFNGFKYEKCTDYLQKNAHDSCWQNGCRARLACPIGRKFRYKPQKSQFHWRSLRRSLRHSNNF